MKNEDNEFNVKDWVLEITKANQGQLSDEQKQRIWKARYTAQELTDSLTRPDSRKLDIKVESDNKTALQKPAPPAASQQQKHQYLQIDLSPYCRIYVGNISLELLEQHLRVIFGQFGNIKSVSMSYDPSGKKHRGYGFIEYTVPEAAILAIDNLDQLSIMNRPIKVGRSKMYPEQALRDMGPAPRQRIYISNIHDGVTEQDIQSIFEEFGRVRSVALPPHPVSKRHMNYGFVEYEAEDAAINATIALNGFDLVGMPLRVTRCVANLPMPKGMSSNSQAINQKLQNITSKISKIVGDKIKQ
ncbi:hypothetical protein MP228_012154 [Amoeboaphelidium protococcarum]|nr:hypothetical protein MP228_012154 [Amoeboaphelidium protococcarum]